MEVAGASDQIWVAEGTYVPTSTSDRAISFVINNGVKVYGGFIGNETNLNQRDIDENETILSGNIGADTQVDNSIHVVDISDSPRSTTIDGFTISGGQADGSSGTGAGGGITGATAAATLTNLKIEDNFAGIGGGISLSDSNVNIDNVIFDSNLATRQGGAIYSSRGTLNVLNSLFVGNQSAGGGAIETANREDKSNIIGNTFYNNEGEEADHLLDGGNPAVDRIISNNIFANDETNDSVQISFFNLPDSGNPTVDISNNLINGAVDFNGFEISEFGDDNILDEEPLFVDAEEGDFRLRLNSPGIDAGDDDAVDEDGTDVAGNPRIYGEAVDIGAYEYGLYLSIDDVRIIEGDTGESDTEFTVTLSDALDLAPTDKVTVEYNSVDRNAKEGSDYTDVTGTLTFDEDTDTQTISVPIIGDTRAEFSEAFNVGLRNATGGAVITDGLALGIIQNDDQLPAGTASDRFFTPDVDVSFYTPSAAEIADILDIIPALELAEADGIAFLLTPEPAEN